MADSQLPAQGRLEQLPAFTLCARVAATKADGLLSLGDGAQQVRVWFKAGAPVAAASSAIFTESSVTSTWSAVARKPR